ncbi:MAG TPA: response regulator transcription factor [Candidatus Blautia pullicola]|uniref:Stage 0 sporulation protein A homolog n=1 Tax=Candidatus Blautia pullicola TaxID=2838498 RepID=A0A9D2FQM8_9FIRM|nr:response regulator transcription factor [Candidatus Blautia pullicola]
MYHIYVVEDHPGERRELAMLLQNALYQVTAPETFEQIREEIKKLQPDLVLMDIELPGTDGLRLCREIRLDSQIPVIFLTGRDNPMDELSGLLTGGDDYITKPYLPPVLLARIGAVLKRSQGLRRESSCQKAGKVTLNLLNSTISNGAHFVSLTGTELRMLWKLMENRGSIVSRQELLDDLWDNHIYIDNNTLSVNMARIREKLRENKIELEIQTRRGQGYMI